MEALTSENIEVGSDILRTIEDLINDGGDFDTDAPANKHPLMQILVLMRL